LYAFNSIEAELGFAIQPEINRTFYSCIEFQTFGTLTIENNFIISGGISLGRTGKSFDAKIFAKAEADIPKISFVRISIHYIYNIMPTFKTAIQTLAPMLSLNSRRAGISLGLAYHFTTFNNENVIIEPVIAGTFYFNFYNTEKMQIGISISNISNFWSGNMGAYNTKLYSTIKISPKISLINDFILQQAGSIALASNFYGLIYRGGILLRK